MVLKEQVSVLSWKMKKYSSFWFCLFLIVITCISCQEAAKKEKTSRVAVLPYYEEASFTPKWLTASDEVPTDFHRIPDFKLVNQLGDTITEATFKDKIYVTDFFFTSCPGICPKMAKNMSLLQDAFATDDEVLLLSHSVTPEIDSVTRLKKYAEDKGVNAQKWHLATGERQQIYSLGRNAYFVEEDLGVLKDINDFLHTENFVLIDKNKHIRGIYNGLNKTAVQQLIADIKTLKKS